MFSLGFLLVGTTLVCVVGAKVTPEIYCSATSLDVRVTRDGVEKVLLDKWSSVPGCQTILEKDAFLVSLKLNSELPCGTTRVKNKLTDEIIYYHKLLITETGGAKHLFKVSCYVSPNDDLKSNIVKRNVLPAEFVEPDYIEITSEVTGTAPIPELSVGVRQRGNLIGDQVTVSPGAPLTMEVYLDSESSPTYGILVSYMMVTDTTDKNETIIFNGCTQDRYVFENFQTNDGDYLTAKFRAFKFPESNYLMFRGTVDVCLDRCQGIRCSNGELGFGRKRRSLPTDSADPNKIFEVTMMTFLKVQEEEIDTKKHSIVSGEPDMVSYREEEILLTQEQNEDHSPPYTFFHNSATTTYPSHVLLLGLALLIRGLIHW